MHNYGFPDANWIDFDATVSTSPDQLAIAPGYLDTRVDRGGPPLFPLRDGQQDPRLLLVPLGALRGPPRLVSPPADAIRVRQRVRASRRAITPGRRHRDRLPAGPRVRPRPHGQGDQGVARLLHDEVRAVPAPPGAHRRVSALRAVRAVVPEHDPVLGGDRLHRPRRRREARRHRLPVLRDRPRGRRTSGGRTR